MQTFEQFELRTTTQDALKRMNYTTPTAVQAQAIPHLMQGRDVVAQARTGTGKTAAFGVPMVNSAGASNESGPVALVLVPTRELANQVAEVLIKLCLGTPARVVAIYGGAGFGFQEKALRHPGPQIVVATPGRLLDHMQRGTIDLAKVTTLVLDEADRMLDMGFKPDVDRILGRLPRQRQTSLFSATVPPPIVDMARRYMRDPVKIRVEEGPATNSQTEQFRLDADGVDKAALLLHLLEQEKSERAIVFTRTKHRAKRLARQLADRGWSAVALQGNMTQNQRERALDSFRTGDSTVLVATDVASRGIDVPEVTHVVNFDVPVEPEAYVHRIGRTARNGRAGRAITFVTGQERRELHALEVVGGVKLTVYGWPAGAPASIALAAPTTPQPAPRPDHGRPGDRPRFNQGQRPFRGQGRPQGGGRRFEGQRGSQGRPSHGGGQRRDNRPRQGWSAGREVNAYDEKRWE